jgi:hypothetical protein
MAWAARTLLELKIWSVYVTESDANLKRFYQDMYVDANSAFKAGEKAVSALEEHPLKAASQKSWTIAREVWKNSLRLHNCEAQSYI